MHIVAKGMDVYATVEREDLYAAIDEVRDEVVEDLKAIKNKKKSLMRRGGAEVKQIVKGLWKNKKI